MTPGRFTLPTLAVALAATLAVCAAPSDGHASPVERVRLLSVDGLHDEDPARPHDDLRPNTVLDVVKAALPGARTARPHDGVDGPSVQAVQSEHTPALPGITLC